MSVGGGGDIDFRLDAGNATFPLFSPPSLAFSPALATFITTSCCLKVFHVYGNVTQLDFEISRQYLLPPLSPSLPTSAVALCRLLGGLGKIQSAQLFDKLQRQRTNERRAAQQEKRLKLFMNSASTPSWLFLDSTWTCTWSGNFALTGIGTDGRADGRWIGSGIALSQVNNLKP